MEPEFGRQWRYEMRNDGEVLDARSMGADSEAMAWAKSRLRELGVQDAHVFRIREDGSELHVGRVHKAVAG